MCVDEIWRAVWRLVLPSGRQIWAELLGRNLALMQYVAVFAVATFASYADLQRVSAALYLSRCPHSPPFTLDAWATQAFEHIAAFPLGSFAMAMLCIVRSLNHRDGVVFGSVIGITVMLLAMPVFCEWSWDVSTQLHYMVRQPTFLATNVALSVSLDMVLHLSSRVPQLISTQLHRRQS